MPNRPTSHRLAPHILREYDIRGIVGADLSETDAYAIGRSFATLIVRSPAPPRSPSTAAPPSSANTAETSDTAPHKREHNKCVAVGYDGRLTSPALEAALVEGLTDSGVDVLRIGMGPTPMLYYATSTEQVQGGIQITGSHNPADYNGFKMVFESRPFFGVDIARLGEMSERGDWIDGKGSIEVVDIVARYVARLLEALPRRLRREGVARWEGGAPIAGTERVWRIAWDCGNGAAGPIVERLVASIAGEHHVMFSNIDGHFPNHPPDPTEEANLNDLRAFVMENKAHFGLAFDGDADRIVVVDGKGRMLLGDQLLQIYAEDMLRKRRGALIIADVKASQTLFDRIAELGGEPLMWKTGHSHIKSKMKEVGSPLAGEMSGHIFFADEYYGYDDALYAAIRLIAAVERLGKGVTALREAMPSLQSTPELRFAVDEERKFAIVSDIAARLSAAGADVDYTDGVRVKTGDGWWLLRASNTQAVLVARAESQNTAGLVRLTNALDEQLALSGISRPKLNLETELAASRFSEPSNRERKHS